MKFIGLFLSLAAVAFATSEEENEYDMMLAGEEFEAEDRILSPAIQSCKRECASSIRSCSDECEGKKKKKKKRNLGEVDFDIDGDDEDFEDIEEDNFLRDLKGSKGKGKGKGKGGKKEDKAAARLKTKACKARCKQVVFRCQYKCYGGKARRACKGPINKCVDKCDRKYDGPEIALCRLDNCYKGLKKATNTCLRLASRTPRPTPAPTPAPTTAVPLPAPGPGPAA